MLGMYMAITKTAQLTKGVHTESKEGVQPLLN